ncbi:MAG: hypothetical protein HOV86_21250 [Thermoactinospora sp.]|nr:hypothetical protein [Thermoactinospora sp.]
MPTASASRLNIPVRLDPDRVTEGDPSKVWILANCPVPSGGPAHIGRATSDAFVSAVTLNPAPATTVTPTPATTATPATTTVPLPWVRGQADVLTTARPGTYTVDVRCEGTNDTGRATLRIVAEAPDTPAPTRTATSRPTRIGAGGGGTYGKPVAEEESGVVPIGGAGVVVGLALVAGIGLALRRRRSR